MKHMDITLSFYKRHCGTLPRCYSGMARARVADGIERVCPGAEVSKIHSADYLDRRSIPREEVPLEITVVVSKINYENFENTVSGSRGHSAYLETWSAMHQLQKHDQEAGA